MIVVVQEAVSFGCAEGGSGYLIGSCLDQLAWIETQCPDEVARHAAEVLDLAIEPFEFGLDDAQGLHGVGLGHHINHGRGFTAPADADHPTESHARLMGAFARNSKLNVAAQFALRSKASSNPRL